MASNSPGGRSNVNPIPLDRRPVKPLHPMIPSRTPRTAPTTKKKAVEAWRDFWTQLRGALPAEVRTRNAVDEWLSVTRRFRRWTERSTAEAAPLASENPAAAQRAAEVIREIGVLLGD
jgi:hypothetical protein